jgi:hypothetical protein
MITTGVSQRRWKVELSVFNGREPDESRADLDLGPLDSLSGRLTVMPTGRLALQISAAHLTEAELESSLSLRDRHTWFGRAELVGKPGEDLHLHATPATIYTIGKIQAGYVRLFQPFDSARGRPWNGLVLGVGGTASVSLVPPALVPRYPGRANPGFGVFASMRPARHNQNITRTPN